MYKEYFEHELDLIKHPKKDLFLEIGEVIAKQGHSGFSIGFIINAIKNKVYKINDDSIYGQELNKNIKEISVYYKKLTDDDIETLIKLLTFRPLSDLTLEDDEWLEVEKGVFQNKRLYPLFKENGVLNYTNAVIFIDKKGDIPYTTGRINVDGVCYNPLKAIPKDVNNMPTVHVDVIDDKYDKKDLEEVFKYYTLEEIL